MLDLLHTLQAHPVAPGFAIAAAVFVAMAFATVATRWL